MISFFQVVLEPNLIRLRIWNIVNIYSLRNFVFMLFEVLSSNQYLITRSGDFVVASKTSFNK